MRSKKQKKSAIRLFVPEKLIHWNLSLLTEVVEKEEAPGFRTKMLRPQHERQTMVCGGWSGFTAGDDHPAMQARLDGVREKAQQIASANFGVEATFTSWELLSYTAASQVVAGTKYSWVCKVKIGENEDGSVKIAEAKMSQFVPLHPHGEPPSLNAFTILSANEGDAASGEPQHK